jgi:N-acetylglucosamine kinase-like BadF-type ATPase
VGIFLGIDGGGTSTTCVVGDETSLLATATAGPSNVVRVGEERARESLGEAIGKACTAAGITPGQVNGTCIGAAGAARPEIAAIVRRLLSEIVSGPVNVVADMETAMQAAFGTGPGVIVNAGTGSFAYGRDKAGRTERVGGWGFAISDEGSGQWIGRTAITAIYRAHDEGEQTRLLPDVSKFWKVSSLNDLVRAANASPPPDFSSLFPIVLVVADAGDAIARSVLTQAGTELARLVKLVIRRLFAEQDSVPVAMTGGVLRQSALVRQVFYNSLRSEYPNAGVNSTVVEPVNGALELARQAGMK